MHPANKLPNERRRVNRARRNHNGVCVTCPASRHVHIMAEAILKGGYPMLEEEPEHCAGSLLSVLESLWKARAEIAALGESDVSEICIFGAVWWGLDGRAQVGRGMEGRGPAG